MVGKNGVPLHVNYYNRLDKHLDISCLKAIINIMDKYELLSISIEQSYDLTYEDGIFRVCEDGELPLEEHPKITERDVNGIPMGRSKEEIKEREKIIKDFYASWIADNPEKKVWNKNLNGYIFVKYLSINETYNKAARTYDSTLAVFQLTEILENAQLVEEQPAKSNNKNQKGFSKMLIMRYGKVKLTVGYQKSKDERVQYGITVPQK